MKIAYFFLYSYLLLKPYYIFNSGGLQPCDIMLLLSFFFFLLASKNNKQKFYRIIMENKLFIIFFLLSFCINIIYFLQLMKFKFILSSLYYVFNFLFIIVFTYSIKYNDDFINTTDKIMKINLIMQLLIYIFSLGKYYDAQRYMGTFNDPNQFGYFVLISYAYIYIFDFVLKKNKFTKYIFFFFSIILIAQSGSTAMLLGITVLIIINLLYLLKNLPMIIYKNKNKIIIIGIFLICFCTFFLLIPVSQTKKIKIENIFIIQRVKEKISKLNNNSKGDSYSDLTIWQERGYDKIYLYPENILYGAGEGEYQRFEKAVADNEIHATLPSILFYYGIIPFMFIIGWFFSKLKNMNSKVAGVYIMLVVESFFLLNQRQTFFWGIFAIAPIICNQISRTKTLER